MLFHETIIRKKPVQNANPFVIPGWHFSVDINNLHLPALCGLDNLALKILTKPNPW